MAKLAKQNCIAIIECNRLDTKLVKFLTLSIGGLCEEPIISSAFCNSFANRYYAFLVLPQSCITRYTKHGCLFTSTGFNVL